jgi:hypothetical protein
MVSAEAASAAEESLARGEAAAARGDNSAALQAFRETLALDPSYTTAQVSANESTVDRRSA